MVGFIVGGLTDELHPFTKSSETSLGLSTDSTALLSDIRQISICVNASKKGKSFQALCDEAYVTKKFTKLIFLSSFGT